MSLQTTFGFRDLWSLGYRRLLPIAPPDAELHPDSALWRAAQKGPGKDPRGKAPAAREQDGRWRGLDLTRMEAEEGDLGAWEAWGASVGVRTGQSLVAVDLDCPDKEVARALATRAWEMLGPAPIRFGAKPKALLLYRVEPEAAYDKVRFLPREGAEDSPQVVELLTEGRQFVAGGIHPRTGRPYEWPHGLTPFEDLTRIDLATLGEFMDEVSRSWPAARRLATGGGEAGDRHIPEQSHLTADLGLVRDAIKHLPNPDHAFPHRDDWITMGAAIKAALGPGLEDDAFDLWEQWSCRWDRPGATYDHDEARNEWARIKPPFRVGAGYVFAQAERLGGWTGSALRFFAPVPGGSASGVRFGDDEDGPATGPVAGQSAQRSDATFEILSLDDIENLPRPKFLVERHIPENSLGFVYGPPGSKKSFLMLDLALHVAYGLEDWHGDAIGAREGANVLYLAAEGSAGIRARVRAWKQVHKDRIAGRSPNFALIRQPLNFMDPGDVEKLARTVASAALAPLDLVIVDTVSRVLPGADENLQKDMTLFVRACDAVRLSFGASVIGVHHSSKGGDMRGSTVLRGAGDFVFSIDKPDASDGAAAPSAFTATKQKDIEDGWTDFYAFDAVALGEGETSLVPRRTDAFVEAVVEADGPVAELALDAMAAAWDRGEPWLKAPKKEQAERGARRRLVADFGMKGGQADSMLALWEKAGAIRYGSRRTEEGKRLHGYEVVTGRCIMDAIAPPPPGGGGGGVFE